MADAPERDPWSSGAPGSAPIEMTPIETSSIELTPIEMECMRCRRRAPMRFAGMCVSCRDELRARYSGPGRDVTVESYEPRMHVTPNAVALKDD